MTKPILVDPIPELADGDAAAPSAAAPDPFDIASLRLNPSFVETAGVKKLLTTIPVRKPSPQDFVRVHPAPEYRENFAMVDLKDDREEYLVHPSILPELTSEVVYKTVFTAINRLYFWSFRVVARADQATTRLRSGAR
jgi:hypothetical protein